MAQVILINWKLRQRVAPAAGENQDDLINTSRIVKIEPSASGPDQDDAEILSKVVYNEMGGGHPIVYYVTDTVAEIKVLADFAATRT